MGIKNVHNYCRIANCTKYQNQEYRKFFRIVFSLFSSLDCGRQSTQIKKTEKQKRNPIRIIVRFNNNDFYSSICQYVGIWVCKCILIHWNNLNV